MTDKEGQRSERRRRAVWMTCGAVSPLVYAVLSYVTEIRGGGPGSSLWQLGLFVAGVYLIVRYPYRYPRLRPFIRGYAITLVILSVFFFVGAAVYGWDEMGVPARFSDWIAFAVALQTVLGIWLIFGKRPRGVVPPPPVTPGGFQPQTESTSNQLQLPPPAPGGGDGDFRSLYDRPSVESRDSDDHGGEPRPAGAEEATPTTTGKPRRGAVLVGGGAAVALLFAGLGIGLGVLIARGPATTTEPAPTVTTAVRTTTTAVRLTTTVARTTTTVVRTTTTRSPASTAADQRTPSCAEIGEWATDEFRDEFGSDVLLRQVHVDVESTREVRPPTIRDGERVCAAELRWRVGQGVNVERGRENLYVCANRYYGATGGADSDPEDCLALLRGER